MKKIKFPLCRSVGVTFLAVALLLGGLSFVGVPHRVFAASSDATLSALSSDIGTLSPSFDPATLSYYLLLPPDTTIIPTISATTNDPTATEAITQASSLEGRATVTVTAQDGVTQETYAISIAPAGTLFLSPTPNLDGTLSATITNDTIASTTSGVFPVDVYIPAGTVVTGPSTWNGLLYPPTDNLAVAAQPQYISTSTAQATSSAPTPLLPAVPAASVELGFGSTPLTFSNHAVRVDFVGATLYNGTSTLFIDYTYDFNTFFPVTNVCSADSQAVGDALAPGDICYYPAASVGTMQINAPTDIILWTTHFTTIMSRFNSIFPSYGSLVVVKDAVGGDNTFSFTASSSDLGFSTSSAITTANGAGSYIITNLVPGTYAVTEGTEPTGWKQTDTNCGSVVVMAGNIASCTITDTKNGAHKPGQIRGTVYKNHARLSDVKVYLDLNDDGKFEKGDPFVRTNELGRYRFANLQPGIYHIREVVPKNLEEVIPASGVYDINLTAGEISKGNKFVNSK